MRSDIEQALDQHNFVAKRRIKKWRGGFAELGSILFDDETVVGVVDGGIDEHGIGLAMVTDIRLLIWGPRTGILDLLHHEIAGVSGENIYGRDALVIVHDRMGQLVLRVGEISMTGMAPPGRGYVHFSRALNELVRAAVPPPAPPTAAGGGSVADEIAKLAQLREQGLITDAEFQAQKQKLLS